MEFKFGSVMLLLSISIQQSLWGILALVPQTNAKKCKHVSLQNEPVKKVQMLRRIPARCSGWDEAWSWLSNKDCRTKYILDYVELPSAVQKVEECEDENGALKSQPVFKYGDDDVKSGDGTFDIDEKALAIAFGSVTGILLIFVAIMILFLCQKGLIRCGACGITPAYTTTNASERRPLNGNLGACNEYVEDGCVLAEPEYEEIDPLTAKKKLDLLESFTSPRYQNVHENKDLNGGGVADSCMNGLLRQPITPSAPYDEDLQQTNLKCCPNEYQALTENVIKSGLSFINASNVQGEDNPALIGEKTDCGNTTGKVACEILEKEEESLKANLNQFHNDLDKCSDEHAHLPVHSNEALDIQNPEQSKCMESESLKCSSEDSGFKHGDTRNLTGVDCQVLGSEEKFQQFSANYIDENSAVLKKLSSNGTDYDDRLDQLVNSVTNIAEDISDTDKNT